MKLFADAEYLASEKFNSSKFDVPGLNSTAIRYNGLILQKELRCVDVYRTAGTDAIHPLIVKTSAETDNSVNIVIISSRSRNLLMASQSILSLQ